MTFKILYVEDNSDNMRLIQKVLRAGDYEVYGAVNGIDGYKVARRIRKSQETGLHSVTMITVTANVLAGDAKKALVAGCDAYMPKPINIHELAARVDTYLSKNVG